jgi:hypothetical protein
VMGKECKQPTARGGWQDEAVPMMGELSCELKQGVATSRKVATRCPTRIWDCLNGCACAA